MEYNRTVEGESIDQILGKWKVIYLIAKACIVIHLFIPVHYISPLCVPIQVLDVEERNSSSASASSINTDLRGCVRIRMYVCMYVCVCILFCVWVLRMWPIVHV